MKAARLHKAGAPLVVETVETPALRPGSVLVKVETSFVPGLSRVVYSDQWPFPLPPTPFTPGMDVIGTVVDAADDVVGFEKGDRVYCNPLHEPADGNPEAAILIGLSGFIKESMPLLRQWRDGGYAEQVLFPAECVTPLGAAGKKYGADILCRLGYIGVAYGGFLRGGFRPGQSVLINGATGNLGLNSVLVALAMGASRIVAIGRKKDVLDRIAKLDRRITTVQVGGKDDAKKIAEASAKADYMIDALGPTNDASTTMAAMKSLRFRSTCILLGGLNADLPINYQQIMLGIEIRIQGSGWFPKSAPAAMLRMITSGTLNLDSLSAKHFSLDQADDALNTAISGLSGFEHVVIAP